MNQPNELKDFWRCTVTIYIENEPFCRYRSVIYGFRQANKAETETIKNLIDEHNPNFNERIYGMLKHKSNGGIWHKNGYIKIFNYLYSGFLTPYEVCKVKDTALVTIETTYNKAYCSMNEMMKYTRPDDFISYMKDRGITKCPMKYN